ncbi:YitT family protein [Sulfuricurvum sp.]|uniref:YitT family protein n=1 Tax=Sulfuricurvum sp. TaxID=2025608 RepID=UPI0026249079|nr:YitT family protein [Sulfuricurvum sp.]MDD4883818.1 YitT family protein [Sulfuricurvum sp.]
MINRFADFPINEEVQKYIFVFFGAVSLGLGVVLFLIPNHIVAGGTPGISILINYFSGIPAGILMFLINIPLVLMSIKFISKGFAVRTVFSIVVSSSTVDMLREYFQVAAWTNNPLLASLFGGIAIGIGLGLMIAGNASAGGPSIIARYIADRMQWKQNNIIIAMDFVIVIVAGIAFARVESALLSLIVVYATGRGLDTIISGRPSKKVVHIFSKNVKLLSHHIIESLGREGVILEGVGGDPDETQKVLMLIIENQKIRAVREIVKAYDQEGFLVVIEASELH